MHARDIHALHVAMSDKPYQANRLLALLSKMFALAIHWGMRGDNPVKGVERYHEERRERWLSDAELKRLLGVLATHPNRRAANAVRLQLLTGARIGEVLAAQWTEIDLERGVWTKPSHHTKQKRTQHLPLSAPAMALLSEWHIPAGPDQPYLFLATPSASRCRTSRTSGVALPGGRPAGLPPARQSAYPRIASGFQRPQLGDRRPASRAYQSADDQALCAPCRRPAARGGGPDRVQDGGDADGQRGGDRRVASRR